MNSGKQVWNIGRRTQYINKEIFGSHFFAVNSTASHFFFNSRLLIFFPVVIRGSPNKTRRYISLSMTIFGYLLRVIKIIVALTSSKPIYLPICLLLFFIMISINFNQSHSNEYARIFFGNIKLNFFVTYVNNP